MTTIIEMLNLAKMRGLTLEQVINPSTAKEHETRDVIINTMALD